MHICTLLVFPINLFAFMVQILHHHSQSTHTTGFERNVTQLQQLYAVAESAQKYEILGLNLLRLLAVDKMAEFHTELELIPQAKRR